MACNGEVGFVEVWSGMAVRVWYGRVWLVRVWLGSARFGEAVVAR
jgi:hypothetical protein